MLRRPLLLLLLPKHQIEFDLLTPSSWTLLLRADTRIVAASSAATAAAALFCWFGLVARLASLVEDEKRKQTRSKRRRLSCFVATRVEQRPVRDGWAALREPSELANPSLLTRSTKQLKHDRRTGERLNRILTDLIYLDDYWKSPILSPGKDLLDERAAAAAINSTSFASLVAKLRANQPAGRVTRICSSPNSEISDGRLMNFSSLCSHLQWTLDTVSLSRSS